MIIKKKEKLVSLNVRIPEKYHKALKEVSKAYNITITKILTDTLQDLYYRRKKYKAPKVKHENEENTDQRLLRRIQEPTRAKHEPGNLLSIPTRLEPVP